MLFAVLTLIGLGLAPLPDQAAIEREAKQIERLIIAPCCWTQPVSDHYSAEADQIRAGIRSMLAEGKTRQQIFAVYVAQYGERVLAEPPARGFKASLHVLPWVVLGLGAVLVAALVWRSRRGRLAAAEPLTVAPGGASEGGTPDQWADRLDEELRRLD